MLNNNNRTRRNHFALLEIAQAHFNQSGRSFNRAAIALYNVYLILYHCQLTPLKFFFSCSVAISKV